MADENKPAFYPRVGNIKAKNFKPAKPMPFIDDERAMEIPHEYYDIPTKENRELSRRRGERIADLERQRSADTSPLEKLAGGLQAGRFLGSALTQAVNSAPTRLFKGDEAADKFMQERMYKPEQPLAYEYAGDVGNFLEKLETEYKIPPILPEAVALQYLSGPATSQAMKMAGRGAEQAGMALERGMEPVVRGALEQGGLPREMALAMGANTQSNVMKPSNKANWLGGSSIHVPERDMWRFKTPTIAGETPEQRIPRHEELLNDPTLNQDQLDRVKYQLEQTKGEAALDKWVDNALMGYFKGQLASPEDPVRLMIERNYANIEAKFAKDQERATKMAQRAEAEIDPRKQANMKRQADTMFVQARDDRDVAMQNISHLPSEMLQDIVLDPKTYIKEERVKAGYPAEGLGTTTPSRKWEHQADEAVKVTRAGDIQTALDLQPRLDKALQEQYAVHYEMGQKFGDLLREKGLDEATVEALVKSMPRDQKAEAVGMLDELQRVDSNYLRLLDQDRSFPKFAAQDNPFIAKLDPETKMYSGYMGDLGFEHVMDVLRQDLAAERLRPEQLNKLSVEQAVKRTQEYNLELARKMNSDRASARSNLPVYKDYPDGYKWVQLNQPGNFAAESQAMGHSVKGYEPRKGDPDWVEGSGNEGSDAYGMGGWEAIKSGRAKVYSLVDSRGAPHVTIEVGKNDYSPRWDDVKKYFTAAEEEAKKLPNGYTDADVTDIATRMAKQDIPPYINQIKGKGNNKPIADYIPYVQDFVQSGKWSDVRDLKNADLVKFNNDYMKVSDADAAFKPRVESAIKYLEEHPALETHRQANKAYNEYKGPIPSPEYSSLDYNRGVTIHPKIPYTYNELKAILKDPSSFSAHSDEIYDTLSRNLDRVEELKKHYGELPRAAGMKRGGKVSISNNPDAMMLELNNRKMAGGGLAKLIKGAKAAAKAEPEIMKASEALGKIEGRPLVITQADRTKVGEGFLGGPGFSSLQLTEPEYRAAEAAWGVKTPGVAKMILGGAKKAGDNPVFTTMIGSPTQHQSNQMVFDKLYGDFKKAAKKGGLPTELRDKINDRLVRAVDKEGNPVFPSDIDILDKNFKDIANTFDRRSIAGHLMGGVQVGGKKGQIIDYDKIIRETTDPALIDVPSGSLGNRLFTLSGGIIDRPDLHPAFPTILQGEDLGVQFSPVVKDILMRDFIEKTMREKGRKPGYMDFTRGYPPSQLITEDILTEMQKLGLKEGGAVKKPAAYIDGSEFWEAAKKHGIKDSMDNLNKIVDLVNKGLSVDDAARQVADTGMHKAAGGAISADDLIIEERPL
jgi:hypothetical protein